MLFRIVWDVRDSSGRVRLGPRNYRKYLCIFHLWGWRLIALAGKDAIGGLALAGWKNLAGVIEDAKILRRQPGNTATPRIEYGGIQSHHLDL